MCTYWAPKTQQTNFINRGNRDVQLAEFVLQLRVRPANISVDCKPKTFGFGNHIPIFILEASLQRQLPSRLLDDFALDKHNAGRVQRFFEVHFQPSRVRSMYYPKISKTPNRNLSADSEGRETYQPAYLLPSP